MTGPAAWTVGMLRSAIAGIPDDTPLVINAADFTEPNVAVEQVIVGAGFGTVDWGDGYGPEPSTVFGLDCEIPDGPIELRPGRPARAITAYEPLAWLDQLGNTWQPSPGGTPRSDPEPQAEP